METVARYVPIDPAKFDRVARFNCDGTSMTETLEGCANLRIDFAGGGCGYLAHRMLGGGVVELVAAQGATERGRVMDYLPWLESRVNGKAVRLITQRRGLMRELEKQGYTRRGQQGRGVIWQKDLYGR
ncbi:MAG: hypothetical protein V4706_14715 [Pseudomonadota bacterium]